MKVRNHTRLIKLKYFGLIYLMALSAFTFIELHKIDYDLESLSVTTYDLFTLAIISAIPVFQMNKVKYVVSQINNINDFIKWFHEYFDRFNGKVIYRTNKLIIFEVIESPRRLFNKRKKSYYKVKICDIKATIEGPSYKKPKHFL